MRLRQSEERRSLALAAGNMGSGTGIAEPASACGTTDSTAFLASMAGRFSVTAENIRPLIHPEDWQRLQESFERSAAGADACAGRVRVKRPNGEVRWCIGTAAPSMSAGGRVSRISGVTVDITERKIAEERQALLAREVDHRAKNALALVQSIVRLTRGKLDRDLQLRGRGAHQGAVARSHHPVAIALAGGRHEQPGRGGACSIPR